MTSNWIELNFKKVLNGIISSREIEVALQKKKEKHQKAPYTTSNRFYSCHFQSRGTASLNYHYGQSVLVYLYLRSVAGVIRGFCRSNFF